MDLAAVLKGVQARANRHNQSLTAEQRQDPSNVDWDHYLVGNEMAGPQNPMWQRLGAAIPMALHEIARPLLSSSNPGIGPNGLGSGKQLTQLANNVTNPSGDQPTWIAEGAGAGGASAEPPVDLAGALHNIATLYRGATEGATPDQVANTESTGILEALKKALSRR